MNNDDDSKLIALFTQNAELSNFSSYINTFSEKQFLNSNNDSLIHYAVSKK